MKLLVPQWTTTYLTNGGTDKSSPLHKTCWVMSLGETQFSVLYDVNNFFYTVDICLVRQQLNILLTALKDVITS